MKQTLRSIKGMKDTVPPESTAWRAMETGLQRILRAYGYREIRMPIIEFTEIFSRSIGDVTDIVQKEMYTFEDRNGDSLTLRPEGTASCVRAVLEHNLLHQQTQKLWYLGPMFRHERPQKGRYRQFHQLGIECFGLPGPDIDAEVILVSQQIWKAFAVADLRLEINSLGSTDDRQTYRKRLHEYFSDHGDELDEDSVVRLDKNPLRILDSKNPNMRDLIEAAPSLIDFLSAESAEHFEQLRTLLDGAGVEYDVNPRLVRGLDYYSNTVFEWITDQLGAQGTVCAGGRYDGLVELMGGKPTPAVGFAMGLERFAELAGDPSEPADSSDADLYIVGAEPRFTVTALPFAEELRTVLPDFRIIVHCGGGSLKSQLKKADRSGARAALIFGGSEIDGNEVTIKPLRQQVEQLTVPQSDCLATLERLEIT